jgi:WD40 repeat protein
MAEGEGEGGKLSVFISYSRDDLDFADQLEGALGVTGFATAVDRHGIHGGEDWKRRLGNLIRDADTVVFVLSPSSAVSDICAWEVDEAVRLGKRIIPVLCRPLESAKPPRQLADLNYIFFYSEQKSPGSGFGAGLVRLVAALNTDLDWLREHTRYLQRASEWEAVGRPDNRLLSGSDIELAKAWAARRPKGAPAPTALHLDFLKASETTEIARTDAARRQLEDIAKAQDERARALRAAEEANRKRARFRAIAFVALTGIAVVAASQAWRAEGQRREAIAATQKAEAETRRAEATLVQAEHEKARGDEELKKALIGQSRFLAQHARDALAAHDYAKAALLALEALPDPGSENPRPIVDGIAPILFDALTGLRERVVLAEQTHAVKSASFSPDGKRLVTASYDTTARLWDAETGKEIVALKGHTSSVESASFSPDGKRVVTASQDETARLWDAQTGKELAVLANNDPVLDASYSPDGKRILTRLHGSTLLWDAQTGKEIADHFHGLVMTASFAADGKHVVTAHNVGPARIWDAATGKEVAVLDMDWSESASFSPDSERVLITRQDATARIWDVATRKEIIVLQGHGAEVVSASFSPDGKRVVTASADDTARLWDAQTGQEIAVLKGHTAVVRKASFSPDGKRVVTASADKTARLWDAQTGKEVAVLNGSAGSVLSATFNPDGKSVVTVTDDGTARIWNAETSNDAVVLDGRMVILWHASFVEDGRRVATVTFDDPKIRIWDAASGKEIAALKGNIADELAVVGPDGKRVVAMSRLWDIETGQDIADLKVDGKSVAVRFSPNGNRIVAISYDTAPRVLDARTGREVAVLRGHTDVLTEATFSPDAKCVVTASQDRTARVWDAESGKEIAVLKGHTDAVLSAAFSPDRERVVTTSEDRTARVWDVETGREIVALQGHGGGVFSALFSPDGTRVVTTSSDKTARLWDAKSGKQLLFFGGDDRDVESAWFSTDGRRLITRAKHNFRQRTVRFYEADTGHEFAVLDAVQIGQGESTAVSPDGKRVVMMSFDGSVRIQQLEPVGSLAELINRATARLPRCLFEQERRDVFLAAAPEWCHAMSKPSGRWPPRYQPAWRDDAQQPAK